MFFFFFKVKCKFITKNTNMYKAAFALRVLFYISEQWMEKETISKSYCMRKINLYTVSNPHCKVICLSKGEEDLSFANPRTLSWTSPCMPSTIVDAGLKVCMCMLLFLSLQIWYTETHQPVFKRQLYKIFHLTFFQNPAKYSKEELPT